MKEVVELYGPYLRKDSRKHFVVIYSDGSKGSLSYPRWLMEQHLGRQLEDWEHVDHIDNDKTNDDISNLQLLTVQENSKKNAELYPAELFYFFCPFCGNGSKKYMRNVRGNWKKKKSGPFCSRSCAGKTSHL